MVIACLAGRRAVLSAQAEPDTFWKYCPCCVCGNAALYRQIHCARAVQGWVARETWPLCFVTLDGMVAAITRPAHQAHGLFSKGSLNKPGFVNSLYANCRLGFQIFLLGREMLLKTRYGNSVQD